MTEIRVQNRFASLDPKIQSQNLGDQVALLFYGKRMIDSSSGRGILGQGQSVRVSSITSPVTIYIPAALNDNDACAQNIRYIRSMVQHAASKGVSITIASC